MCFQNGGDFCRRHPSSGNTVLHVACARGHYAIADYLIQRFIYYDKLRNSPTGSGNSGSGSLLESVINLENNEGRVPLILAAERGKKEHYSFGEVDDRAVYVNVYEMMCQVRVALLVSVIPQEFI